MQIKLSDPIEIKKELNIYDKLTFCFVESLDKLGIRYAIVAGYVALVFNRIRNTEDVDLFVENLTEATFSKLWDELNKKMECVNASSPEEAYHLYLKEGIAVRFSMKGTFVPNIEMKFVKRSIDIYSVDNAVKIILNGKKLLFGPLELQIVYKMYLGSDKDIEDAIFIYRVLKEKLNEKELFKFLKQFEISDEVKKKVFE
jgi:hypothetical protein